MKYSTYRLYYRRATDNAYVEDWRASEITFKARTDKEAMRKANKFWQDGGFGIGSITVKEVNAGQHLLT